MGISLRPLGKKIWETLTPQNEEAIRRGNASAQVAQQRIQSLGNNARGVLSQQPARQQFVQQNQPTQFNVGREALTSFADTLTKPSAWQEAPKVNVGSWKGSGLAEDFINSPFKVGMGGVQVGQGEFKKGAGNIVSGLIEGPAGLVPIGKVVQAGKGAKLLPRVTAGAKQGIKEGAIYSGAFGAGNAASQDASFKDIAIAGAKGAAIGAGGGLVFGGGAPIAVAGVKQGGKLVNNTVKFTQDELVPNQIGSVGPEPKPKPIVSIKDPLDPLKQEADTGKVFYHGTSNKDLKSLTDLRAGSGVGKSGRNRVYVTENPEIAKNFGDNVIEQRLYGKHLDVKDIGVEKTPGRAADNTVAPEFADYKTNKLLTEREKRVFENSFVRSVPTNTIIEDTPGIHKYLASKGYTTITVPRVMSDVDGVRSETIIIDKKAFQAPTQSQPPKSPVESLKQEADVLGEIRPIRQFAEQYQPKDANDMSALRSFMAATGQLENMGIKVKNYERIVNNFIKRSGYDGNRASKANIKNPSTNGRTRAELQATDSSRLQSVQEQPKVNTKNTARTSRVADYDRALEQAKTNILKENWTLETVKEKFNTGLKDQNLSNRDGYTELDAYIKEKYGSIDNFYNQATQSQPPKSTPKTPDAISGFEKPDFESLKNGKDPFDDPSIYYDKNETPAQFKTRREQGQLGKDSYLYGTPTEIAATKKKFAKSQSTPTVGKVTAPPKPKVSLKQPTQSPPKVKQSLPDSLPNNTPIKPKVSSKKLATSIDPSDPFGNRSIINRLRNEAGSIVDEDSQMIKMLRKVEKETGREGLVDQWYFDSGNVRASASRANAKIKNSPELKDALSGLSKRELKDFDDYVASRAELKNYDGLQTSRSPQELEAIVRAGDSKFGDRFAALNQYYKNMANDMYESGLVSKQQLDNYLASDDYVRIQRDMDDLVGAGFGSSKARSIGSTTAGQKRKGSAREALSPTQTALTRTQQIQLEIQRNTAATNTLDVLQELGLAKEVKDSVNKNTVSRLVDGQRQTFEVPGDIKRLMDNVEPYRLGVIARIVSAPTRLFRAGTTALNAPFTVTNYLRDQSSSAIYSKSIVSTHHPKNIIAGMGSATRDFGTESKSPLWKKFEEFAGDQTIFDELRNAQNTKRMLREVRKGKSGKLFNMATNPIRSLEDLNSITEKATRFQNFKGIYEKAMKEGLGENEAIKRAVLAARQNSVDFQRNSSFTRVANLLIPYFNASVQGSRNVVRSFKQRPVATTMKSAGLIAAPTVAITTYNLADPERREIYESINDFEKEDNFILISPWAKQRDNGLWEGIFKVPKPHGYRELTDPSREITEAFMGKEDPKGVAEIAKEMVSGLTGPINIEDGKKLMSSFIPAIAKPWIQLAMNQDLYTGSNIVPDFMIEGTEDPTKRAFKGTSGSAKLIAKQLNVSPIQVEKAFNDIAGSIGRYTINTSDNILAKAGVIGEDEIGGRSVASDFSRRLAEASGKLLDKNKSSGRLYYESRTRAIEEVGLDKNEQAAYDSIHPDKTNFLGEDIFDENKRVSKYTRAGAYLQFPKTFEVDKRVDAEQRAKGKPGNPIFDLKGTQLNKVLLKQALPPGSKDPELSNLYKEEWYQDYQNKNSKFYESIKESMAKEGKQLPQSDNPYPSTPPDLQKIMDTYSSLPKGTGARSNWIRANPTLFKRMTDQWSAIDAWENKERVVIGLEPIVDDSSMGGSGSGFGYGSGRGRGGGGSKKDATYGSLDPYKYAISPNAGGKIAKPKVKVRNISNTVSAKKSIGKPKVTSKKSLV